MTIIKIPCDACQHEDFRFLFNKESANQIAFAVVECRKCHLVQVNPQPDLDSVLACYKKEYFSKRTKRGYNNYFSPELKAQINRVYAMNLGDLEFEAYEKSLQNNHSQMRHLDVGCAAGYFVEFMQNRNWRSRGIELSKDAASHGIAKLGLDIIVDDFLVCKNLAPQSYEFLSFWASIEHMHSPKKVLQRCYELLVPGGRLILSTCRWGLIAKMRGINWRYMNVPEHLYFFSLRGLQKLAHECGFETIQTISYGSGFTTRTDAGLTYRIGKKIADPLVKRTGQGDMMALHLMRS